MIKNPFLKLLFYFVSIFTPTEYSFSQHLKFGKIEFEIIHKPFFSNCKDSSDLPSVITKSVSCTFRYLQHHVDSPPNIQCVVVDSNMTYLLMNGVYYLIFSNGRILRNEEPNEMVMTLLSRKFFNLKTNSDKVNNRDKMSKRNAYDSIWGPTIEYRLNRPQGNMSENFHSPYFNMNEIYILAEKDSIPVFFEQTMSIEGGFDQLYSYRLRKITQLDIVETDSIFNFYQTLVSIENTNNANITETLYKQPNRNYSNLNSLEFFDLEGQKVQIINPNQLTLVKFWYIGCLPCMSVIPVWNELYAQFEHRNVSFVSINSKDNSTQKIKHFLNKREIKGIHIHDLGEAEKQLGVKGYPTIILINRKGEVVREWIGTNSSLNDELIETINLELSNR